MIGPCSSVLIDRVCRWLTAGESKERFDVLPGLEPDLTQSLETVCGRGDLAALEDLLQLVVALRGELASPTAARIVLDVIKATPAAMALLRRRKPRHDVDAKRRRFDRFSDRTQAQLPVDPQAPAPGSVKLRSFYHPATQGRRPGVAQPGAPSPAASSIATDQAPARSVCRPRTAGSTQAAPTRRSFRVG